MSKCSGITQAGTACKGIPIDGSSYCYVHHPDHAEERRRHGKKGGKRGGRGRPQAELSDLKARLSELADDVLAGNVDRSDAAVAGQLLNTVIRAVGVELKVREQQDLIERLEELESLLESQKGDRRMGLRDRLRRLRRAAEEDAVLIRQKDGSVRAFPRDSMFQEVFLSRLDAALGRPPRDSEIMQALEGATPESRRDIEQAFVGTFMEDLEPRDEPVPDLSE